MEIQNQFKEKNGLNSNVITEYNTTQDKGNLTSRKNGYVGGYIGGSMTKKLVEMAEQQMTERN